jgi:hypothetical protein
MKAIILTMAVLGFIACKKKHTEAGVEKNLSDAMLNYLWTTHNKDTSNVKFQVLSVYYFEEKLFYECDFNVHMRVLSKNYDTTGLMKARVSKDFSIVKRKL